MPLNYILKIYIHIYVLDKNSLYFLCVAPCTYIVLGSSQCGAVPCTKLPFNLHLHFHLPVCIDLSKLGFFSEKGHCTFFLHPSLISVYANGIYYI